jgi:hypothetical protein
LNTLELRALVLKAGHRWVEGVPAFIVIRHPWKGNDEFNDVLYHHVPGMELFSCKCTSWPGVTWLSKSMNPKGCAIIKPGQYFNAHVKGVHKGYPAMIQNNPLTVYRDRNNNGVPDDMVVTDTGMFGINIHRAKYGWVSRLVGAWSAGCIVVPDSNQMDTIMTRMTTFSTSSLTIVNA